MPIGTLGGSIIYISDFTQFKTHLSIALNPIIYCHCVVPENIHTPTTEGIGHARGVGGSKAQEIPEGRGG